MAHDRLPTGIIFRTVLERDYRNQVICALEYAFVYDDGPGTFHYERTAPLTWWTAGGHLLLYEDRWNASAVFASLEAAR